MPIEIERSQQDDQIRLRIAGTLDVNTASEVGAETERIVHEKALKVVVDLSGLDLIDSSGVAVLVALYKRVRAYQGHVVVSGARDQPLAIFKLLRMDKVFLL